MSNSSKDGWPSVYLKSRQLEIDNSLPEGSVKAQQNGRFTLAFANLTEDQVKQLSHLWYVISQTQPMSDAGQQRSQRPPAP
jgi:hypothetical protein